MSAAAAVAEARFTCASSRRGGRDRARRGLRFDEQLRDDDVLGARLRRRGARRGRLTHVGALPGLLAARARDGELGGGLLDLTAVRNAGVGLALVGLHHRGARRRPGA